MNEPGLNFEVKSNARSMVSELNAAFDSMAKSSTNAFGVVRENLRSLGVNTGQIDAGISAIGRKLTQLQNVQEAFEMRNATLQERRTAIMAKIGAPTNTQAFDEKLLLQITNLDTRIATLRTNADIQINRIVRDFEDLGLAIEKDGEAILTAEEIFGRLIAQLRELSIASDQQVTSSRLIGSSAAGIVGEYGPLFNSIQRVAKAHADAAAASEREAAAQTRLEEKKATAEAKAAAAAEAAEQRAAKAEARAAAVAARDAERAAKAAARAAIPPDPLSFVGQNMAQLQATLLTMDRLSTELMQINTDIDNGTISARAASIAYKQLAASYKEASESAAAQREALNTKGLSDAAAQVEKLARELDAYHAKQRSGVVLTARQEASLAALKIAYMDMVKAAELGTGALNAEAQAAILNARANAEAAASANANGAAQTRVGGGGGGARNANGMSNARMSASFALMQVPGIGPILGGAAFGGPGGAAAAAGVEAIRLAVNVGSAVEEATQKVEQQQIAFTNLFGTVKAGNEELKFTRELAAKGLDMDGLVLAERRFAALNLGAELTHKTLLAIGDAVGATGNSALNLEKISKAMADVATKGRLQQEEIRQFSNAGIPIVIALSEHLGIAADKVTKLISQGGISARQTFDAFIEFSQKNYGGALDAQSRSMTGLLAQFENLKTVLMATFGTPALAVFEDMLTRILAKLQDPATVLTLEAWGRALGEAVHWIVDLNIGVINAINGMRNLFGDHIAMIDNLASLSEEMAAQNERIAMAAKGAKDDMGELADSTVDAANASTWLARQMEIIRNGAKETAYQLDRQIDKLRTANDALSQDIDNRKAAADLDIQKLRDDNDAIAHGAELTKRSYDAQNQALDEQITKLDRIYGYSNDETEKARLERKIAIDKVRARDVYTSEGKAARDRLITEQEQLDDLNAKMRHDAAHDELEDQKTKNEKLSTSASDKAQDDRYNNDQTIKGIERARDIDVKAINDTIDANNRSIKSLEDTKNANAHALDLIQTNYDNMAYAARTASDTTVVAAQDTSAAVEAAAVIIHRQTGYIAGDFEAMAAAANAAAASSAEALGGGGGRASGTPNPPAAQPRLLPSGAPQPGQPPYGTRSPDNTMMVTGYDAAGLAIWSRVNGLGDIITPPAGSGGSMPGQSVGGAGNGGSIGGAAAGNGSLGGVTGGGGATTHKSGEEYRPGAYPGTSYFYGPDGQVHGFAKPLFVGEASDDYLYDLYAVGPKGDVILGPHRPPTAGKTSSAVPSNFTGGYRPSSVAYRTGGATAGGIAAAAQAGSAAAGGSSDEFTATIVIQWQAPDGSVTTDDRHFQAVFKRNRRFVAQQLGSAAGGDV